MILGDNYSTFEGWIPKDYAVYYPREVQNVTAVEQTHFNSSANLIIRGVAPSRYIALEPKP